MLVEHSGKTEEVLSTLNKRYAILQIIRGENPDRRQIARQSDVSKTTVYRSLAQLEEAGLVRTRENQYQLTELGEYLFEQFTELSYHANVALNHLPFVQHLPDDVDPAVLGSGETVRSDEYDPQAAYRALRNYLGRSESVVAVTPVVHGELLNSLRECIESGAVALELVICEQASSRLEPEKYGELTSNGSLDISIIDTEPEFGIYVGDETVALTTLSKRRQLTAVHLSEEPSLVSSITKRADQRRRSAQPLFTDK